MYITVGENTYELSTKLGTAMKIEQKFKLTLPQIFAKLENAEIGEFIDILLIATGKLSDTTFTRELKDKLIENWDYLDLQMAVQTLIANLMFSGTPEQIEGKLSKFQASDAQKNALRELLGIATVPVTDSTGVNL